jgi:hypothetical protein
MSAKDKDGLTTKAVVTVSGSSAHSARKMVVFPVPTSPVSTMNAAPSSTPRRRTSSAARWLCARYRKAGSGVSANARCRYGSRLVRETDVIPSKPRRRARPIGVGATHVPSDTLGGAMERYDTLVT